MFYINEREFEMPVGIDSKIRQLLKEIERDGTYEYVVLTINTKGSFAGKVTAYLAREIDDEYSDRTHLKDGRWVKLEFEEDDDG